MVLIMSIITAAALVGGLAANMWQGMKQQGDIKAALEQQRAEELAATQAEEEQRRQEIEALTAKAKTTEKKEAGNLGIIAAIIGIVVLIAILYTFSD